MTAGWVSRAKHWTIRPSTRTYSGPTWIAECNLCTYTTGRKGAPGFAENAVRAHFNDKHRSEVSA